MRTDEPDEIVLLKRNLLTKDESGAIRASVAGVLMCCDAPERFLPGAFIEAVRYRGIVQDSNMEKRGDGVPIILHESESVSGRRPEYRLIDDSELLLTIFAASSPEEKKP